MKTITIKKFMSFRPCDDYPESRIREIAGDKKEWSALDILALKDIPAEPRLWTVLRPELIAERILHLFACEVAEGALKLVKDPRPASVSAPEAKRKWLAGEITDEELAAAWAAADAATDAAIDAAHAAYAAAWSAADYTAVRAAAWSARAAAWAASEVDARYAAYYTANTAAHAAAWSADAARAAAEVAAEVATEVATEIAARAAVRAAAREEQVRILIRLLTENTE